jgi:exonuclease SbcC
MLLEQTVESAKRYFESTLKESGFESLEDAEELLSFVGAAEKTKAETEEFFKTYELVKNKIEQTDTDKFIDYDPQVTERLKEEKRLADEALSAQNKTMGANQQALENLLALREKYQGLLKELATKEERRELCDSLRSLLHGNKFLEFIASEYLQEICVTASKTLLSLTGGRYFLQYDKEFKVGDNLDGGNLRAVRTLSGGETFLVSLSLALSLSAALCLKSLRPIEFFFLDEGFGTLDEKLVDTVMDVLGKLSKNFAVGLISHVEELKHRIDNKVLVTGATESRGSTVRVETF